MYNEENKEPSNDQKKLQYWKSEIHAAEKHFAPWLERGKKVVERYKGESSRGAQFNVLWSNTNTLKAALFAQIPKPDVTRRWKEKDDVGRVAATIIERALEYEVEQNSDYRSAIKGAIMDRLLPGRGIAWVRFDADIYEPSGEESEPSQITEDLEVEESEDDVYGISNESTPCDYVHWEDFLHQPARTWEEVDWGGRRVYLKRKEAKERFGEEVVKSLKFIHNGLSGKSEEGTTGEDGKNNKACIYEIWCKSKQKVYWISKDSDTILDEQDDPLELENFFPFPKPIYATTTTDSLIPIPDFTQYQDQAAEVDELTERIKLLTKALAVRGVYDKSEAGLKRLLTESAENKLIPVDSWAAFAEKGGVKGSVDFMPIQEVAMVLESLVKLRETAKQSIYEITGISDIVRGSSNPNETLGAQQIKSNFASMRLNDMKDDIARFVQDLIRIKAEIMCSKYSPETLIQMSGIDKVEAPDLVMAAMELVQNEAMRNFRIEIDVDSLVQMDREQDKQSRIEFLGSVGAYVEKAVPMAQQVPEMAPLLGELLMFGVRGFKVGRSVEGAFYDAVEKLMNAGGDDQGAQMQQQLMQMQEAMQQQQMQAQQQIEQVQASADLQAKTQIEQAKIAAGQQTEQAKMSLEQAKMQAEQVMAAQKLEIERFKVEIDKFKADTDRMKAEQDAQSNAVEMIKGMMEAEPEMEQEKTDKLDVVITQLSAPKRVIRDDSGMVTGIETEEV